MFEEENMASSVAVDGPIAVSIDASDDFGLYKDGKLQQEKVKYAL